MKRICKEIIFILLSFFLLSTVVSAVTVDDTTVIQVDDSENIGVSHNYTFPRSGIDFNLIHIDETWIMFNETSWNISSGDTVNITLRFLYDDVSSASVNESVCLFNASCTSGLVYFNLSGFDTASNYSVYVDDVYSETIVSDGDGDISFNYDSWSSHEFELVRGDGEEEEGNLTLLLQITYGQPGGNALADTTWSVFSLMGVFALCIVAGFLILTVSGFTGGNKGGL